MEEVKEAGNKQIELEDLRKVPEDGPYYQFGGFWRRLAASIIDGFIISLLTVPFVILFFVWLFSYFAGMDFESPDTVSSAYGIISFIFLIIFMIIPFIYYWILMVKWQTTIGKKLLGMKIVKMDGTKITLGTVFLRQVLGAWIASFIFNIGYLWIGYDVKKRSWADMVAGTYVVHYKELTKEEYRKQVNRDQHKDRFIVIVILWLVSPFLLVFLFGLIAVSAIVALNPIERLNEAKMENCRMECSENQLCIDECLEKINGKANTFKGINNDGWVGHKSIEETYEVNFPSKPTVEVREEKIGDGAVAAKMISTISETSDASYVVVTITLPDNFVENINKEEFLSNLANIMAQGEGSKIISSKNGFFEGQPSIEYVLQTPEGYVKSVSSIIDNRFYLLAVASPSNSFPKFERFTKSFLYTDE